MRTTLLGECDLLSPGDNEGMTQTPLTFTKVARGYYATPDGRYAVAKDGTGYVTIAERDGSGVMTGCDDDGWSWSFDAAGRLRTDQDAGETMDWLDTKRDAVAACQRHAARVSA